MANRNWIATLTALALAACNSAGDAPTQSALATTGVTDAMLAAGVGDEWLSYGGGYDEQRFSPLTQISDQNVGELGLAWFADLDTARGQEATPLMHDGTLYVSTAWSMVKAYDAKTGALKWSYDPQVPRETLVRVCCDAVNRGVALYGDKVYVATLDGRLVALDMKTGKEAWSKMTVPDQESYAITGAPRIAKGKVLIGSAGSEYRARGYISAYDAQTGEMVWRFHTVPGNPRDGFENDAMARAAKTWEGKWWEFGGGGTVWDSITYDPGTNLVYFGTGNAEPWNPKTNDRGLGDALYTSSIVAVNADTGEYAWHFQETPEDRWDFDSNSQITIANLDVDGAQRRVVMHAPKNGFYYVLDAKTGKFLSGEPFAPVNWADGLDPVTGRPNIRPEARYEQTGEMFLGTPGLYGAHTWHPMSFSPNTGLMYIPANNTAQPYLADENFEGSDIGGQMGIDGASVSLPADKKARADAMAATTGHLLAWDPVTQTEKWRVEYPGPSNGGTMSTAGNLVFQGTAGGEFRAYSADAGKQLWSFPAQTGIIAAPMTYAIDGEQYVAILAGWGGLWDIYPGLLSGKSGPMRNISRLLVFKLGANGKLPPAPPMNKMVLDPPPFTGTQKQVDQGKALFARYCSGCHGDAAISGALNPDLRHSGAIASADTIKAVVLDGALKHNGMVSFKSAVKAADAEAIRQYLIKRANEDKALEGT
ncbi:PQQ-dependent dehydrogenase, methanol/ethanol family [Altererythrobacter confluentis]|uniref:PQQ-dependent dehydrogenase, methanol/ethanol family n=1 Tax=Allopontixanthobacter confluentis TaxID=1849021 RepID=A0A6L7GHE7_9SPHN|nr:PQQ-dependent dehydrogenase, methanol/ethanol family [Allopontixanthobacter confluentis]MXP14925.1 PQQ-dependent dehydrogenase, methanol/ethanol family [Allopontixanthobacter confluentis]